jgi:hypothetical protein
MTVTTDRPAGRTGGAARGAARARTGVTRSGGQVRATAGAVREAATGPPGPDVPVAPPPRTAPAPPAPRTAPAPPASRAALALLRQAGDGLAEAHREVEPLLRYPAAYLAALRAAAAVLAVRAKPRPRRGAPRDVWNLLAEVAPEMGEWAAFFASCSDTRAAAEAGIARLVGRRDADDLLRQAEQFVGIVRGALPVR